MTTGSVRRFQPNRRKSRGQYARRAGKTHALNIQGGNRRGGTRL